ncbi:hypothetical protein EJ03DRAFT_340292 [Teratosphaeria nubilosa]|uniref:Secreted protein n=1 Tax=Teratosphaeria nubilosa TaxID=161662 RepID=A0A6G1KU87_9PEZI|nr:hypothetical protein EJ03DRAFT_340292 [Teratosphaeria nubilosa]
MKTTLPILLVLASMFSGALSAALAREVPEEGACYTLRACRNFPHYILTTCSTHVDGMSDSLECNKRRQMWLLEEMELTLARTEETAAEILDSLASFPVILPNEDT